MAGLRETYDTIAEDWAKDHSGDTWWVEGTDKFLSLLPQDACVLDAGCGAGVKSKYISSKGPKVIGIDFSKNLLAIAHRNVPAAEFRVLDLRDAGTLPEEFDGVFAQASLLHIPKAETAQVVESLASRLTHGGYFYIAVKEQRPGTPDEETVTENDYGYDYSRFFSYYTVDEVKGYLERLGMTVVHAEVSRASSHTNWVQVIARKP
jgi:SAM-dependent methyltransferase